MPKASARHAGIAGSKLEILDSGGHFLSRTRTPEFNRVVLDFRRQHNP